MLDFIYFRNSAILGTAADATESSSLHFLIAADLSSQLDEIYIRIAISPCPTNGSISASAWTCTVRT
jgi:hypothetical protein